MLTVSEDILQTYILRDAFNANVELDDIMATTLGYKLGRVFINCPSITKTLELPFKKGIVELDRVKLKQFFHNTTNPIAGFKSLRSFQLEKALNGTWVSRVNVYEDCGVITIHLLSKAGTVYPVTMEAEDFDEEFFVESLVGNTSAFPFTDIYLSGLVGTRNN